MRVLVVRVGAMGDVLHALPAVAALRAAIPAAHVGWAIEPRWEALLRGSEGDSPLVDAVHPAETRLWKRSPGSLTTLRSVAALRRSLRAAAYDVAIDLQGSVRSATIGRIAGAPLLVGPATPRERPARWLYGRCVETRAAHVVEQAVEIAAAAMGLSLTAATARLPVDAAAERWWRAHAQEHGQQRFVFLAPQAGWGAKQWPAARFGEVARRLHGAGYRVLVNQTQAADPISDAVLAASGGTAEGVTSDVPQLIAMTRRASLVIAGDTGPLHLAAALGRPVVGLFGPTDPARTGPFGTVATVLRHSGSVTDHRRHANPEGGLLQITSEAVAEAALELLKRTPGETAW